jgi:hypothetical protein
MYTDYDGNEVPIEEARVLRDEPLSTFEATYYILALDDLQWHQKMDTLYWLLGGTANYKRNIHLPAMNTWINKNAPAVAGFCSQAKKADKFIAAEKERE